MRPLSGTGWAVGTGALGAAPASTNLMFYTRPVTVGNPVPFRGGDPFFHLYGVAPMAAAVAACDLPLEP